MGNPIRRFDPNDNPLPIGTPAPAPPADSACTPTTPTPGPSIHQSPLPPMPRTPVLTPRRTNDRAFFPTSTSPSATTGNSHRIPEILGHHLRDTFVLTPLAPVPAPLQPHRRGVVLMRQDQGTPVALQNMVMESDGGVVQVRCEICGDFCFDGRWHCTRQ